ncbi:MAG: LamG-like jellyroll fold domain-containing protein [Patescibacteria group bacterium]
MKIEKTKKIILVALAIFIGLIAILLVSPVLAQVEPGLNTLSPYIGLGTQDLRVTIARIVQVAFGLLGIITVVLVIIGGVMYLLSGGEAEKIQKAKNLLVAAVIGLVITLSAFAIASFVINELLKATGAGGPGFNINTCPNCYPPCDNCGPIPGQCPDPNKDSPAPYICSLSGINNEPKGATGDFITIMGGKFGATQGNSKVFFRKGLAPNYQYIETTIVNCGNDPVWHDSLIKVEVPSSLQFDNVNAEQNIYKVVIKTGANNENTSEDKSTALYPPYNDDFTLLAGLPGPGVACLQPDNGAEGTTVTVLGKRFGTQTAGADFLKFPMNVNAQVGHWDDETILSSVPPGAVSQPSNLVFVQKGTITSNGSPFYVKCDNITAKCSADNCCSGGYCSFTTSDYCKGGPGEPCSGCSTAGCRAGNYCDTTNPSSCICKEAGPGAPCSSNTASCVPSNDLCGRGFYCATNAATACTCQSLPQIDSVRPDNGAPGNFITITGQGFGTYDSNISKIIFLGTTANNDEQNASLPTICGAAVIWQDKQVVVEVPAGAVNGPIKLINADSQETTWDNQGAGGFTVNNVKRPGLCPLSAASPDRGEFGTLVSLSGKNFGTTKDSATIGGGEFDNKNIWTWLDDSIKNLKVPNILPGVLPVQVKVGSENSNPVNFTVTQPAKVPKIDYLDPSSGPIGQYVTIFGSNFGEQANLVKFLNLAGETDFESSNWLIADTNFPAGCSKAGYWHDTYIIVKVPSGLKINNSQVVVKSQNNLYSNTMDFTRNNNPVTPGICAIAPDQGPVGISGVTLYGENFGTYSSSTSSQVNFWQNKIPADQALDWSANKIGAGLDGKQGQSGSSLTVPIGAITGPVQVTNSAGVLSNKVQFKVNDCRVQNICAGSQICCQADGVCKNPEDCGQAVYGQMCTYSWSFTTGKLVSALPPQVIEDIACTDKPQSPTPWKKSVDNCTNIWVSARFNKLIDPITLQKSANNIEVKACGTADNFNFADCNTPALVPSDITTFSFNLDNQGAEASGFEFQPDGNLEPNTWYRVTLKSGANGIYSLETENQASLQLDGDFDGQPGGEYSWYFKTKNSNLACDVEKVVVTPQDALIIRKDQTQDYNAFALANNCNILDSNFYDWNWYKVYSTQQTESAQCDQPADPAPQTNYCTAKISLADNLPLPDGNNKIDYKQTATPEKQGLIYVGAKVSDKKDDNNRLVIDLNIPEIDYFTPTNGLVRPEVKTYVTIYGKNFGAAQGTSQVFFDNIPAQLADCKESWSDTMIKVQVPQGQSIPAGNSATYKLPTPGKEDGMLLFYDFEETSNVLISDRINGFDGEIKGTPAHINDLFKQALYLNNYPVSSDYKDYVKLPNQNLGTGSLEFWFKPQGSGTLFSATDGTAVNAFSLDYSTAANTKKIIKDNDWNYLAYTYDGSQANLYLNGFNFNDFTGTGIILTGNFIGTDKNSILIGAKNITNLSNYFKGEIDNFSIFSAILTQELISRYFGLSAGQVLFLKFEDTGNEIIDSSPNKFTGIASSGNIARVNEGMSGKAISFNSDNQYSLNIANDPSLNFNKEFSIEGWIKTGANPATQSFYSSDEAAFRTIAGGFLRLTLQINNGSDVATYYAQSTNRLLPDQWNYFAGTYDGQKIQINLNGTKTEFNAPGFISQSSNFNSACIGSCSGTFIGSLDEIAIYNRVLSDSEINSRVGAKDMSHLVITTDFGKAISPDVFSFSNNIYPFLCSLEPNFGVENTPITATGANFGDSNKTVFNNIQYGVGSYVNFNNLLFSLFLTDDKIKSWSNQILNILNPLKIDASSLPENQVYVAIDPFSEPYNDLLNAGTFSEGDPFADLNNNGVHDQAAYNNGQEPDLKSNTLPFYLSPVITSISPDNGPISQWVTISGYNFGDTPGKVYFFNNQAAELPPAPCERYWTNNQIIVVVPAGTQSGDVYLVTAQGGLNNEGIESNRVRFTVNDNLLGAGLCQILPAKGKINQAVTIKGVRFEDTRGESNLIFSKSKIASINNWSAKNIAASVPAGTETGSVVVTKRILTGKICAGFHIGAFCPSNTYENSYTEVVSNPLNFKILTSTGCTSDTDCEACGLGTSSCVNGICTPYIANFTPLNGKVGTWVDLQGCYFGCETGNAYFKGLITDPPISTNDYKAYYQLKSDARDVTTNFDGSFCVLNNCHEANYTDPAYFNNNELLLNGSDYVKVQNYSITSSFTALAWAKSGTNNWNQNGWIMSSRSNNGFIIHPNSGKNTWTGYILNKDGLYLPIGDYTVNDIKQWHQYGVSYNEATKIGQMIFDGQVVATRNFTDLTPVFLRENSKIDLYLGVDSPPFMNRFGQGSINEARLYNRELAINELQGIYTKGGGSLQSWIPAQKPSDCKFWQCSPNADNDHIIAEVPNKNTATTLDDAITGQIKVITSLGLETVTATNFEVNDIVQPNICTQISQCGNNSIEAGEQCDGTALPSPLPECPGNLPNCTYQCADTCTLLRCDANDQNCTTADQCGNNAIDNGEECDYSANPPVPSGLDCTNFGYPTNSCTFNCDNQCLLSHCDINGQNCVPVDSLCGNGNIDTIADGSGNIIYQEECDGTNLNNKTCADVPGGFVGGTLSCFGQGNANQCNFDTALCAKAITRPKVEAISPADGETAFCRNGIMDIFFDSLIDQKTLEQYQDNVLTNRNIKLEACTNQTVKNQENGLTKNVLAYFRNIFSRLFGYEKPALAQTTCTALSDEDFYLRIYNINNKTVISVTPNYLLDPAQIYRVQIVGGDQGVKSLSNGTLDVANSTACSSADTNNCLATFLTQGTAGDDQSGICQVNWIDTKVYRAPFTSENDRIAEYNNNDLFVCAGKDDCHLDADYDQDATTSGNQHIYEAVAKYNNGWTLKANYQWSRTEDIDPQNALEIYNRIDNLSTDINKVKNTTGRVYTTAKPIKEVKSQLLVEAQAQGSLLAPVTQSFNVLILMCENPWPSIKEKFPLASIPQAFNSQTYYCRDNPAGLLPEARILIPPVEKRTTIENLDFQYGNLFNWIPETGQGELWFVQPVESLIVNEGWIINTALGSFGGKDFNLGKQPTGILSSRQFVIEGDELRFKIGGSNHAWPSARLNQDLTITTSEIEEPGAGNLPDNVTAVTLEAADAPESTFYVRAQATGSGDNILRDISFKLPSNYTGKIGIIKIYDNNVDGYVMFDDLRQYEKGVRIPIRF